MKEHIKAKSEYSQVSVELPNYLDYRYSRFIFLSWSKWSYWSVITVHLQMCWVHNKRRVKSQRQRQADRQSQKDRDRETETGKMKRRRRERDGVAYNAHIMFRGAPCQRYTPCLQKMEMRKYFGLETRG